MEHMGETESGSFWDDENGIRFYFPDKPWNWDLSYKHQDKDKLCKTLR